MPYGVIDQRGLIGARGGGGIIDDGGAALSMMGLRAPPAGNQFGGLVPIAGITEEMLFAQNMRGARLGHAMRGLAMPIDLAVAARVATLSDVTDVDSALASRMDGILPEGACSTLYVDGVPLDCTRREAAHIFRPFIGYKGVRIMQKDSIRTSGEKVVLCFVEFMNPQCAATALEALQGYKVDEADPDSLTLRLRYARYKTGGGGGERRRGGGDREDNRGGSRTRR